VENEGQYRVRLFQHERFGVWDQPTAANNTPKPKDPSEIANGTPTTTTSTTTTTAGTTQHALENPS
jgi:hypothetical protein